jgi:hypothetical protein
MLFMQTDIIVLASPYEREKHEKQTRNGEFRNSNA